MFDSARKKVEIFQLKPMVSNQRSKEQSFPFKILDPGYAGFVSG